VDGELPAGPRDGSNRVFTLAGVPTPADSLAFFKNGVLLKQGVDYVLTNAVVTLAAGITPISTDRLEAWYRLPFTGTPTLSFSDNEAPVGSVNGVNRVFTLAGTPLPASSLRVFRNGLLQRAEVDYDLTVNTITFRTASTPQTGDILQVSYRF
jgi:hypothetical protein